MSNRETLVLPKFEQVIDRDKCRKCKRCIVSCGYNALEYKDGIVPVRGNCVACLRCVTYCPEDAITIKKTETTWRENEYWTVGIREELIRQSETGGMLLASMGADTKSKYYFDHIVIDACQVTNPSIDPLREPMEIRTYIGGNPEKLDIVMDGDGKPHLKTKMPKHVEIDIPIIFAPIDSSTHQQSTNQAWSPGDTDSFDLIETHASFLQR